MSCFESIFCCVNAMPTGHSSHVKPHKDPNREVHEAIFASFMNFASRRQTAATLMSLIRGSSSSSSSGASTPNTMYSPPQEIPDPILTTKSLIHTPITSNTSYVIHLTSRHDFGPVFSHRYFVCPSNLQHDWVEASLQHWFAFGADFGLKAEKWDVKCPVDSKFFRLTLRPNLAMRFHPKEAEVAME